MRWFLFVSLLLASSASAALAAPAAVQPTFGADTSSIEASAELQWTVPFGVFNPFDTGLYLDSLSCDVTPLDAAAASVPLPTRFSLTHVIKLVSSISAREGALFEYSGPALAEHARLTFTLKSHRNDGTRFVQSSIVEARPGPLSRAYPSELVEVNGRRIEMLMLPAREAAAPRPGILLVHGHGSSARSMLSAAHLLSVRGYSVLLFSMPGYGQSDGPADFMGPATLAAAGAALDRLKRAERVDSTRLAAYGVSRGATVVTELALRRPEITSVIAQSGIYDLWAVYRGTKLPGLRENIVSEAGRDSAAWRERSPALDTSRFNAHLLLFHGEQDTVVPLAQAKGFAASLTARGVPAETRIIAAGGNNLQRNDTSRYVFEYLKRTIGN